VALPPLDDVARIIDDLRGSHPSTELIIDPDLRASPLPAELWLTIRRLVQEAATNVRRHGDPTAPVVVSIRHAGHVVTLTVENRMLPGAVGTGYGIVGMQERVTALNGSFFARPDGQGRWVVRVELPLDGSRQ
jgi:signal transduction histidine kinase